jgi:hypothetical protein
MRSRDNIFNRKDHMLLDSAFTRVVCVDPEILDTLKVRAARSVEEISFKRMIDYDLATGLQRGEGGGVIL